MGLSHTPGDQKKIQELEPHTLSVLCSEDRHQCALIPPFTLLGPRSPISFQQPACCSLLITSHARQGETHFALVPRPLPGPGRVQGATPPLCCFTANQGRRPGLGAGACASTKGRKCKESPAV